MDLMPGTVHVVAPPVAPTKKPEEKPTNPIIRQPILKPAKDSPLRQLADTLSSDGAVTNALAATSKGDGVGLFEVMKAASNVYQKPLALLNGNVQSAKSNLTSSPRKIVPKMPNFVMLYVARLGKWWRRERRDRSAVKALPNRDLDSLIVEGMVKLYPSPNHS